MFLFLHKPFPHSEFNKKAILSNFLIGCFVALFLIVFQPFQISEWQTENKTLKLAGFGLVSFVLPLLMNFTIAKFILKKPLDDNWTIGKEIIAITTVLLFIALGNLIFGFLLGVVPFTFKGFLFAIISVLLVGVFPISVHVFRKHNKLLKINLLQAITVNQHLHPNEVKDAISDAPKIPLEAPLPGEPNETELETSLPKLIFVAENEKDKVELFAEQLLYIESADNYSNLVFFDDDKLKKQLIRSSLKRIESQVNEENILRCHRTFIVNLKNVSNVEGNAAGYKLSFDRTENTVPVSRNYGAAIISKLKTLK